MSPTSKILCSSARFFSLPLWIRCRHTANPQGLQPCRRLEKPKLPAAGYLCNMKILMVCLGNICRSPLAEGILRKKIKEKGWNWNVESAGTNSYHTGEPPHPLSQKVAILNGIDISNQRAKRFSASAFEQYDRIYALAQDVLEEIRQTAGQKFIPGKINLLMNELQPGQNRDVPDPWYGPEPGYHEAFQMINAACDALIDNIQNQKNNIQATHSSPNNI